jgi:hypothetical protein
MEPPGNNGAGSRNIRASAPLNHPITELPNHSIAQSLNHGTSVRGAKNPDQRDADDERNQQPQFGIPP